MSCSPIFVHSITVVHSSFSYLQTHHNPIPSLRKSDFSTGLGLETELNRHTSVGSKRCQSGLARLVLKCNCLRQIEVNQICVRGLLLRALSLYSWQQWAHWWIAGLYVKLCVYGFRACVWQRECDWESVFQIIVRSCWDTWKKHFKYKSSAI